MKPSNTVIVDRKLLKSLYDFLESEIWVLDSSGDPFETQFGYPQFGYPQFGYCCKCGCVEYEEHEPDCSANDLLVAAKAILINN